MARFKNGSKSKAARPAFYIEGVPVTFEGPGGVPVTFDDPPQVEDPLVSEATEVNTMHRELLAMGMDMITKMIALGEKLDAIKDRLEHGSWEDWVQANLSFSSRTARRYMEAYRHRDDPLIKDDPVLFLDQIRGKSPELPDTTKPVASQGNPIKSDTSVRFEPTANSPDVTDVEVEGSDTTKTAAGDRREPSKDSIMRKLKDQSTRNVRKEITFEEFVLGLFKGVMNDVSLEYPDKTREDVIKLLCS